MSTGFTVCEMVKMEAAIWLEVHGMVYCAAQLSWTITIIKGVVGVAALGFMEGGHIRGNHLFCFHATVTVSTSMSAIEK